MKMPRKSSLRKLRNKVAKTLATRDTEGEVKCCIPSCPENHDLVVHHRYKPYRKLGDQWARLKSCEKDPENCELVCKKHRGVLDAWTDYLWEDYIGDQLLCQSMERLKEEYTLKKEELEKTLQFNVLIEEDEKDFEEMIIKRKKRRVENEEERNLQ